MVQIEHIIRNKPAGFMVISGDDGLTYPMLTMGASGVISVIGNLYPKEFGRMVHFCLNGQIQQALPIHRSFDDLFSLLFEEGNPSGIKCALNIAGLAENELRLPLVPVSASLKERIKYAIEKIN